MRYHTLIENGASFAHMSQSDYVKIVNETMDYHGRDKKWVTTVDYEEYPVLSITDVNHDIVICVGYKENDHFIGLVYRRQGGAVSVYNTTENNYVIRMIQNLPQKSTISYQDYLDYCKKKNLDKLMEKI